MFGASLSETTMRPDPKGAGGAGRDDPLGADPLLAAVREMEAELPAKPKGLLAKAGAKVRTPPCWPRSWANFSPL